jgi:hypothetical protein
MDEKEYEEIFHKDDRNIRALGYSNKRNNVKEIKRRMEKMEKRNNKNEKESS